MIANRRAIRTCPFVGMGINCHYKRLPVAQMQDIGANWVRIDKGGRITAQEIEEKMAHYCTRGWGVNNILWIINNPGENTNPCADAALLASYGILNMEVGNEVFGTWWSYPAMTYPAYRDLTLAVREAAPSATLYGMGHQKAEAERMEVMGSALDVYSLHPYGLASPGGFQAYLNTANTVKPKMISEINAVATTADASIQFVRGMRANEPKTVWCMYDGPATDARGLFDEVGGDTDVWAPNAVWRAIAAPR